MGCSQSGTESVSGPGAGDSGDFTVNSLLGIFDAAGTLTDLRLNLRPEFDGMNEQLTDLVTYSSSRPISDCDQGAPSYPFGGNFGNSYTRFVDEQFDSGLTAQDLRPGWLFTGWKINPDGNWSAETGGVLARKVLTLSLPLPSPETGTVTSTQTFTVRTAPQSTA